MGRLRVPLGVLAGLRTQAQVERQRRGEVEGVECPTGKTCYADKESARRVARLTDGSNRQRSVMRAYRCPYCPYVHIGHRRGGD